MSELFSLFAAVATLAGMATFIGTFNGWPAHETIGCFVVCAVFALLSVAADRAGRSKP